MKIIILLSISFILTSFSPVMAQGCFDDNTENELLGYLNNIHRLQNKPGEETLDSLYAENNKLNIFLTYYVEHGYNIVTDVNRLIYAGMDFSVSDDNNCAVFGWELYSYIGMHLHNSIIFYKAGENNIHSMKFLDGITPYSVISIQTKDKQTVYLTFWDDSYSLKGRGQRVMAYTIGTMYGEETLIPYNLFIDEKNTPAAFLEYKYNITSYTEVPEAPAIILNPNRKKLSIPIVSESGSFNGKYDVYNFNGRNFISEKARKIIN